MMKYINMLVVLVAIAISAAMAGPSFAGDYLVIVNANNGASGSEDVLKQITKRQYLKQQSAWPDGEASMAFARKADSPIQAAFMANVLGMNETELHTHWLRLKQTTGETPPRSIGSARIIIRQVSKKKGAFGAVSKAEAGELPAEVKVLFEF